MALSSLSNEDSAGQDHPALDAMSKRALKALMYFGDKLSTWNNVKDNLTPLALMDRIIEDIDYQAYINDGSDEGYSRWENVQELRRLAAEIQNENPEAGLETFLERVALVSDQDTLSSNADIPTLLTLHAAKGLEFPVVFIAGLNEGTLPHNRSIEDPEAMMEECRLLYVGITRAKDRLYLLYAQNRSAYGYNEPAEPSRYLTDIPEEFLIGAHVSRRYAYKNSYKNIETRSWQNRAARSLSEDEQTARTIQEYHPGMRVEHPKWGEGMVLNSRLEDDDEIVDIFFEDLGMKRVAASLARLTKR